MQTPYYYIVVLPSDPFPTKGVILNPYLIPKRPNLSDFEEILPNCPRCSSNKSVRKAGTKKLLVETIQRYLCKQCKHRFTNRIIPRTPYSTKLILRALTYFNLGHTLAQTQTTMQRKYKSKIPVSTLNNWVRRFEPELSFIRLRRKYTLNPNDIIHSKKFHHQQVYEFKLHTLKTNIAGKAFPQLKFYITSIHKIPYFIPETPFQQGPRCSELRIDLKPQKTTKHNNAPRLTELALTLVKINHERHQKVEDFFLINDSATIASEIPVYLNPNELTRQETKDYGIKLKKPLSGHIDILQVRWDKIHILDYKLDAKRNDKATADQVFLYALALSKRTKIPLDKFICAYFDKNNYYQFTLKNL